MWLVALIRQFNASFGHHYISVNISHANFFHGVVGRMVLLTFYIPNYIQHFSRKFYSSTRIKYAYFNTMEEFPSICAGLSCEILFNDEEVTSNKQAQNTLRLVIDMQNIRGDLINCD